MDKLSLVMPILGLYAELYAYATRESATPVGHASREASAFFQNVLHLCRESRDEIFPKSFRPAESKRQDVATSAFRRASSLFSAGADASFKGSFKGSASASSPEESFASPAHRGSGIGEKGVEGGIITKHAIGPGGELELFGILVEECELMIDEDEGLRDKLADNVARLRAKVVEKRMDLKTAAKTASYAIKGFMSLNKATGLVSV